MVVARNLNGSEFVRNTMYLEA